MVLDLMQNKFPFPYCNEILFAELTFISSWISSNTICEILF